MNELQIFKNEKFGEIRTLNIDGEPWFVGKDIAATLGYSNASKAVIDHVDGEDKRFEMIAVADSQNGNLVKTAFINESGVYSLILGSKLEGAKKFKRWITHDVIPTIRKTGGYVNDDALFLNTYLPNADESTRAMFLATLQTVRDLNARIEADKPKVLFADAVSTAKTSILVGEFAKILKQNGIEIGQNRLFDWLRENGYLIKRRGTDYNMPTQYSMERGWFEIKETSSINADGSVRVNKTPKVTVRGQEYFIQRFLG